MNGRENTRGLASIDPSASKQRHPTGEVRNGGGTGAADGAMSRAQKFEDEKRRIIQSCFSKRDADGAFLESYITHIRITEDAAFPASPAPPTSQPENKKPRLVIVAVRKSGRVRMHKARENNDGSFSIGKTWMLDDLAAIQSYTDLSAATQEEQQQKQWASNVGFIVTVGKPYYWQAATSKEKDFFIGSLVKIYKKYTGGKVPRLIGFDDREQQLLVGTGPSAPTRDPNQGPPRPNDSQRPPSSQANQPPGYANRVPSREGRRELRQQNSEERFLRNRDPRSTPNQFPARPSPQFPPSSLSLPSAGSQRDQPQRTNDRSDSDRLAGSALDTLLNPKKDHPDGALTEPTVSRPRTAEQQADRSQDQSSALAVKSSVELVGSGTSSADFQPNSKNRGRLVVGSTPEIPKAMSRLTDGNDIELRQDAITQPLRRESPVLELRPTNFREADGESRRPTTPAIAVDHDQTPAHSGPNDSFSQKALVDENYEKASTISSKQGGNAGPNPSPRGSIASTSNLDVDIPPSFRPRSPGAGSVKSARNSDDIPLSLRPGSPRPGSSKSSKLKLVTQPSEDPPSATIPTQDKQDEALDEPVVEVPVVFSSVSPPESPVTEDVEEGQEAHRPGLGPMVKKKSTKDIAGAFRKAANAYSAFRPRPGGAGDRLMAKQPNASNEPDGITSVVPAPLLRGLSSESVAPGATAQDVSNTSQETPKVEITRAVTDDITQMVEPKEDETEAISESNAPSATESRSRSKSPSQERRRKRREETTVKYCQALNIDPRILDGRSADFDDILTDLGWNGRLNDDSKIEDLAADIRREMGRVQASSWLGNVEHQDGKVDQLANLIDKTIEECEELDGLLTLYSHELNTLHDDVAYIEAQSQGLQVQTANQKLLQTELQSLLRTLSISSDDLKALREASLSNPDSIRETEAALAKLYKAMLTIDSEIRQNKKRMADAAGDRSSIGVYADTEVGQMRAIREKKDEYRIEARLFLQRLKQFMPLAFKVAEQKMMDARTELTKDPLKFDSTAHDCARKELWVYYALMLFAREVSSAEWYSIINLYEHQAKLPYQNEFRDNHLAWKQIAKKATGDELELLFTHNEKEKESDGITTAARKLTVRRGKTVRATGGQRLPSSDKQEGKIEPYEAFSGSLRENLKMISEEQNFIILFFHLNSLTSVDFPDLLASASPENRRRPDMSVRQAHEPDRDIAKKVEQIMDGIYSGWPNDMQSLADWAINVDPLQGVGVLFALERAISEFEESNQEFIVHSLQKLHSRLTGLFSRFVDEQIRGIEDTKVRVNKRKGVISFIKIFPDFAAAIETMLAQPSQSFCDIRTIVNDAYDKINRAMWESLKFIAKEAPGQQPGAITGAGDPEDKEALNYHILLIENMNHYIEEVDVRGLPVLERWRNRAFQDYQEHMILYMDAVIRRPLGKLLDFAESTESLLSVASSPTDIATRSSHSRHVAKKLLSSYDSKELRRGAELLKKRVEKHFGDADDPGLSRSLVIKVFKECEVRYAETYDRIKKIIDTIYDGQLEIEWNKEEATAMFKKL